MRCLRFETMFLNLEEVVPFSEYLFKLERRFCSFVALVLREHRRRHARHAGRKSDQSLAVFGEQLFVDARLVVETFGVSLRRQAHEVLITLVVLRQQYQVKVCFLTGRARGFFLATAARDVSLTTDDRLHAVILHRVIERDRAEHVAMISHGARRHTQFVNAVGKRFDLNCAVEKTVISMQMEVYELCPAFSFRSGYPLFPFNG